MPSRLRFTLAFEGPYNDRRGLTALLSHLRRCPSGRWCHLNSLGRLFRRPSPRAVAFYDKYCASSIACDGIDVPVMRFHDRPHNGKAKPHAMRFGRIERFEEPPPGIFGQAMTPVCDSEFDTSGERPRRDRQHPFIGHCALHCIHCVECQIEHDLLNLHVVPNKDLTICFSQCICTTIPRRLASGSISGEDCWECFVQIHGVERNAVLRVQCAKTDHHFIRP